MVSVPRINLFNLSKRGLLLCVTLLLTSACQHLQTSPTEDPPRHLEDMTLLGYVEWLCLKPENVLMKARVDSGATTSSIHAENLTHFERDGDSWVRFTIAHDNSKAKVTMERKVVRFVRIVQHDADSQRRPVVELEVRVADLHYRGEFTLADRSNFAFPALIGRNFLADVTLIDSGRRFIHSPPCS